MTDLAINLQNQSPLAKLFASFTEKLTQAVSGLQSGVSGLVEQEKRDLCHPVLPPLAQRLEGLRSLDLSQKLNLQELQYHEVLTALQNRLTPESVMNAGFAGYSKNSIDSLSLLATLAKQLETLSKSLREKKWTECNSSKSFLFTCI